MLKETTGAFDLARTHDWQPSTGYELDTLLTAPHQCNIILITFEIDPDGCMFLVRSNETKQTSQKLEEVVVTGTFNSMISAESKTR